MRLNQWVVISFAAFLALLSAVVNAEAIQARSPTPSKRSVPGMDARAPLPSKRAAAGVKARAPVPSKRLVSQIEARAPEPSKRHVEARAPTRSKRAGSLSSAKRSMSDQIVVDADISSALCPDSETACPLVPFTPISLLEWHEHGFECVNLDEDITSCGGCSALDVR